MPHPIDVHVGQRIRHLRQEAGVTQPALAAKLGVRFQQLQKYETAQNRISASKLALVANALGQPIAAFFDGAPQTETTQ